jgi:hypothetical protein
LLAGGVVVAGLSVFAGVSLATAPVVENEVRQSLDEAAVATCDVVNDPTCAGDATGSDGAAVAPEATEPAVETPAPAATAATAPDGSVVAPPPTTAPAPTTTVPLPPISQLALGDSVMLGAAIELSDQGFVVDAVESRQFVDGLGTVQQLQQQDRLGEVVVVHLGTNGTIDQDDMAAMMASLADVPQVLLLTLDVDRDWIPGNNALIYDTVNRYPNVDLLDWAGLAAACPGDCFAVDGYHLRDDGKQYYAALIDGILAS